MCFDRLGSAFDWLLIAAGQRCMAISVAVLVGQAQSWLPDLIKAAQGLKITGGFEKGADLYGP